MISGGPRLFGVVVLSFLVSAGLASVVNATLGGGAQTFQGDGDPNVAVGSDAADTMHGAGGGDFFRGRAGSDTLNGDDGDDLLIGDDAGDPASFDSVNGAAGNDEIAGGAGADYLSGGDGNDTIGTIDLAQIGLPEVSELGNDTIFGNAGNDIIDAGPGDDGIDGGDGFDLIDAGDGNDTIAPGSGADEVIGGDGTDRVSYEATAGPVLVNLATQTVVGSGGDKLYSIERATGSSGDDTLTGDAGANLLDGSLGGDVINGGAGADTLNGGDGADTLRNPGPTNAGDTIAGGDGNDVIEVRNGVVDTVDCGAGSDEVTADANDVLTNCETIRLPDDGEGPGGGGPGGDKSAPQTSIDDGPAKKVKTKKKKAKVTFAFSSSETGSSFECTLDGESLGKCSSPISVKVKKGEHVFTVAATDAAGNTDATPAKAEFKVVKKKKKRKK
jgi:Ca2+-binding RTX toxin-like protein